MARLPKCPRTKFAGARDVRDAELLQADAEQFARGQHFGDVVLDVGVVRAPRPARPSRPASSRCMATAPCADTRYSPACENRQPRRIAAMPKTLEKVRQTNRFGYSLDLAAAR